MKGSLHQRGPTSWRIRVFLGHEESGKKRYLQHTGRWLEAKATDVEPTTLACYRWIVATYVKPGLGKLLLDKIRAMDLDVFYASLPGHTRDHPIWDSPVMR